MLCSNVMNIAGEMLATSIVHCCFCVSNIFTLRVSIHFNRDIGKHPAPSTIR